MEPGILIGLAVLTAAAIGAGRTIVERRRTRRALLAKPALDPRLAEGTEVRATGVVRAVSSHSLLEAPLSGRRCVAYRARLQTTGGLVGSAARPHEAVGVVPFVLEQDDGTSVQIDSDHARFVDLRPTKLGRDAASRCEQFALLRGVASGDRRRARYEEIVVEDGMSVSVSGLLMKDPTSQPVTDDERGYRDDLPPTLRLAGNATHPIIIGRA